jgi:hypothetical protein
MTGSGAHPVKPAIPKRGRSPSKIGSPGPDDPGTEELLFGNVSPPCKVARHLPDMVGLEAGLVKVLSEQLEKVDIAVSRTLRKTGSLGTKIAPWKSEWRGEKLVVAVPISGMNVDKSIIDQIMFYAFLKVPHRLMVISADEGADSVPELSAQDERFCLGILSALGSSDPPSTFKCSSSNIQDLTYSACWNSAAAKLILNKEARGSIHPSSLPPKGVGGHRPSEYLSSQLRALKTTLGQNYAYIADTIDRIIKIWSAENAGRCYPALQASPVTWSTVLHSSAEWQKKKIKGKEHILLKVPLNPKEAAWVLPSERKFMSPAYAPVWGALDAYQKEWAKLTASETHSQFSAYVTRIKDAYRLMHRISDAAVRKLGHRKAIILACPEISRMPKSKREQLKPGELASQFVKSNLVELSQAQKEQFDPWGLMNMLHDSQQVEQILENLMPSEIVEQKRALLAKLDTPSKKACLSWLTDFFEKFKPADHPFVGPQNTEDVQMDPTDDMTT